MNTITRRDFMKTMTILPISTVLFSSHCSQMDVKRKPNIIFILADDLGYGDLGCYGQENFSTPNIDRMASEGMRFTQHYAGSTVCAPSRSSLMTGQHTGHTPIRGNKEVRPEGQVPLPASAITIAELLRQAGYITGAFGKWGLGFPGSEGEPQKQGFAEFFGYKCQRVAHHYYPWYLWHNEKKIILSDNAETQKGIYAPNLIHQKSIEFLEKYKDSSFFLFIPSIIPHAELFAPEEYMKSYRGKFLPETAYEGVDNGPYFRMGPYGSQPEAHAAFAAMINLLDDQVGEILVKVNELGLENNTLILFSSDNGPHKEGGADPDYFDSNGPLKGYKRDLYEGGIRVPMIARWQGRIEAGTHTDHISAFWDFLPTVCDIAGIQLSSEIDGISFLPTLYEDGFQKQHDFLYWEFHEQCGKQAIRKGDWKAIRLNVKSNPDGPIELYNLREDPGEEKSITNQYPKIVDEMIRLMAESRTESEVFPM